MYEDDYEFGWVISHAEELEDMGWKGVVQRIRDVVGDNPVYSKTARSHRTATLHPLMPVQSLWTST